MLSKLFARLLALLKKRPSIPPPPPLLSEEDYMSNGVFRRVDSENPSDWDSKIKDEAGTDMKEIVFDPSKHIVAAEKFSMREVLDGLMDKMKDDAVALLSKLVEDKKIAEFRVAPIGAVVTQEYKPARISVTIDATGKVVDAQQG